MAKKHYFTGNLANSYVVTPSSKDTICIHGDTNTAACTLSVDTSDHDGYSSKYWNIPTRVGNDLVIKTIFVDYDEAPIKTVTTTIQNYYTDTALGNVKFDSWDVTHTIKRATTPGRNGLYASDATQSAGQDFILASSDKNAELTLKKGGSDFVYDEKGNDKYNFAYSYGYSGYDTVLDMNGNDFYYANTAGAYAYIYDNKGNDTYETSHAGQVGIVNDYKGNDIYKFSGSGESNVYDYAGNDKYYIYDSTQADDSQDIHEHNGKDYYEIVNSAGIAIWDDAGNDKYVAKDCTNLSPSYDGGGGANEWTRNLRIDEEKGNDVYDFDNVKYDSHYADRANINEFDGNDKYSLKDTDYLSIYDSLGKDNYTALDTYELKIEDDAGNDNYNLSGYTEYTNIVDHNGNDKYNALNAYELNIEDDAGNDNYNLSGYTEYTNIVDNDGNDKYTLKDYAYSTYIYDYAGKDAYSIAGTYEYWTNYSLIEDYGSTDDKYDFKYVDNGNDTLIRDDGGNDKYTFQSCEELYVYDDDGNDKYTVKNLSDSYCEDLCFNDYNGSDIYDVKGSYNKKNGDWIYDMYIEDYGDYQDTYNLQFVSYYDTYDYGTTKDTYNIKSSYGWTQDYGGNDVYNISNLLDSCYLRFVDTDGTDDKMTIGGVKKGDVVLMTDISSSNKYVSDSNALIVYDKKSHGFVYIYDFYTTNSSDTYNGFGGGQIETIKAGGALTMANESAQYQFFNSIKSDVAGWLSNNGYASVEHVLSEGTIEAKDELIAYFTTRY